MDKSLFKKAVEEQVMSANEALKLDSALEGQDHLFKMTVKGLNDSEPSLNWRSDLNQKILAAQTMQRRRRTWSIFGLTSGLATAAALATIFVATSLNHSSPLPVTTASDSKVEAAIIDAHADDASRVAMGFEFDSRDSATDAQGS